MSEETCIRLQPRTGQNERIRVQPSARFKLGIYQRVMNWCGKNQLATAILVIMFVLILSQQILLVIVNVRHESEMRRRSLEIQMWEEIHQLDIEHLVREARRGGE